MHYQFTFLIVLTLSFFSCGDDQVVPIGPGQDSNIGFEDNKQKFNEIVGSNKGTDYMLNDVVIHDDHLSIEVTYSGGCKEHSFELVWNEESITDSYQLLEVALVHDGNDDLCEAAITEEVIFPFTEIPELKDHLLDHQSIRVHNASNANSKLVFKGLPSFSESNECVLSVTATDVICGDGLFDNRWFEYATGSDGGSVYLQPTSLSALIQLAGKIDEGEYLVGVRLSEPFEPDPGTVICLAYPGPSIPVSIFCIEEI